MRLCRKHVGIDHAPLTIDHEGVFMAKEVFMPALGIAQETGTLLTWHKRPGEMVSKGELLMTVATDKSDVDIEASTSGVLGQVTANEGDEIPVGQVIALLLTEEEVAKGLVNAPAKSAPPPSTPQAQPAAPQPTSPAAVQASPVAARLAAEQGIDLSLVKPGSSGRIQKEDVLAYLASQATATTPGDGRVLASPKARRLAQENDIDLAQLSGSGPNGAVLAADVLAAAEAATTQASTPQTASVQAAPAAQSDHIIPQSRGWRIMAQRLQQSWQTVPHFYLERTVDAGELNRWRASVQERSDTKITVTDLLVKLVALALQKHERLNASWLSDNIVINPSINIGLAVAVEDGLLVPVVPAADQLGLSAIARRRAEIVERAQAGKSTPDDLSGGTFTISNLGMFGIDKFNAIVNPPQAAILAVGRIVEQVVPRNGQAVIRPMLTLTLSCDHRVVDGARAAQFLQTLTAYIEDPLRVLD
jgi:pyruvate dehydrogenase E2 component (dihydrolipoamide acetyltransferase)